MGFTMFGVDPFAAVSKYVFQNKAADVVPSKNFHGKYNSVGQLAHAVSTPQDAVQLANNTLNPYVDRADSGEILPTAAYDSRRTTGNTNLVSGGGGGTGGPAVSSALVNSYMSQLGALPQILANLLASNQAQYDSVMGGYQDEFKNAEGKYNESVTQNELNRDHSIQAAELAAAQGARGLRATLAAIGALGGTGELLANRAVAGEANRDMGGANDTFDSNATSLNRTWADTQVAERKREADARAQFENANTKSRGDVASQHQGIYEKLASLYSDAGDTGTAESYIQKGIAHQPDVTAASRAVAPRYDTGNLAFSPGQMAKYLGGQNDMSVNVMGGASVPSGTILTNTKKRDLELA